MKITLVANNTCQNVKNCIEIKGVINTSKNKYGLTALNEG